MDTFNKKVSDFLSRIKDNDQHLAEELQKIRRNDHFIKQAELLSPKLPSFRGGLESMDVGIALETIVLRIGRPVLEVFMNKAVLEIRESESEVWRSRLESAKPKMEPAIRSVGRIEVENHSLYKWLGTGWLVDKNVIVTNRHVAEIFGKSANSNFVFRLGQNGKPIKASIDFFEEMNRPDEFSFFIDRILHIENDNGPDLAFLHVEKITERELPGVISLTKSSPSSNQEVAVIGYPARDSRIPDQQLMIEIFGDVYDKKRLSPGQLTGVSSNELMHDCSTLGGNSGSVVLDLNTGEAVGIHYAGRFLESNYAVPASLIKQSMKKINGGSPALNIKPSLKDNFPMEQSVSSGPVLRNNVGESSLNFTIPLNIEISVTSPLLNKTSDKILVKGFGGGEKEEFIVEGKPLDYDDRNGYNSKFLGTNVPLPEVSDTLLKKEILEFNTEKGVSHELKYCHFSVVMNRSRRLCFFSACNIDGKQSFGMDRVAWRLDPRIPHKSQISKECYGNPPKFSRGHMTRREDPIWGSEEEGVQGNADSMHVTNAVPQMQSLNAGIWLGLENFALQNAREDNMQISVFTGPVFRVDDPVFFGVHIPVTFWKVLIFIHDKTGKLCATGYSISQKEFLSGEEFIFGQHKTYQIPVSSIEKMTGLSFGNLSKTDPLNKVTEVPQLPLTHPKQIIFF